MNSYSPGCGAMSHKVDMLTSFRVARVVLMVVKLDKRVAAESL